MNNSKTFIPAVQEFDVSSSGVKPGIFTEDSTEASYFKTMLPEHILDVLTAEANILHTSKNDKCNVH
jgi:hypothetical protein